MRDNSNTGFEIVCLRRGEIVEAFEKLGRVHIIEQEPWLLRGIRRIFGFRLERLRRLSLLSRRLSSGEFDLIYANTVASISAAIDLAKGMKNKPKIIAHVHEGRLSVDEFSPDLRDHSPFVSRYIAASGLVATNLIRIGIDPERIRVVYEFSMFDSIDSKAKPRGHSGRFTIGGSGLVNWRKGTELFILVANHCSLHFPDLELDFVWVGKISERESAIIEEDIRKCCLNNVQFVGQTDDPGSFFRSFDLFLMTSREDPFPLVCIESGQLSIPIICFEGATGTQEVIVNGGGRIVPYMDIQSMAEAIREYYHDRDRLRNDGETARIMFSQYTAEKICPIQYKELLIAAGMENAEKHR
jgi:glycosyltransferase involved in cell wall biosynthesis